MLSPVGESDVAGEGTVSMSFGQCLECRLAGLAVELDA